ncbi:toll-like receptor 13 [Dermochelys coriacea]|uniref:toll-like receptor 13 n=1 Tax=Dermochelys coriacea TaxID=27794 RepID=UPI0018E7FADB|nr:toll-like receptor 13 [Dermochelys coriacea]
MGPFFPLLASLLLLMPGASAYGFRNCIQSMEDPHSFRCIQRFLKDIISAVGDLPPDATFVNVSHNSICRLPAASFHHLPQLQQLQLVCNHLETIEDGAFENLSALDTLNLSNNRLAKLSEGAFRGLGNLTHLSLRNNPLSTIHPHALQPLGNLHTLDLYSCRLVSFADVACSLQGLTRLQVLNLSCNNLRSLNSSCPLPPSLSTLHLCNNSLRAVDGGGPLLLRHIRSLDLSYNNISNVTSFAGAELQNLSYLLLKGNPLDVFHLLNVSSLQPRSLDYSGLHLGNEGVSKVCQRLGNHPLKHLLLQSNNIRELRNVSFSLCPPIRTLDLSWNKLKWLDCVDRWQHNPLESLVVEHNLLNRLSTCQNSSFLEALHFISFRYNRILSVKYWAFRYAPNLRILHLNINTISYLHKHALKGLYNLTELRLDNNLLTDLYEASFTNLVRLRTLNLRNNRVSILFPCVFRHLSLLRILDLGGNNIRHLTSRSFSGLRSLSKLYLDGNRIKEISSDIFHLVQATLEVLDLTGNKLQYITKTQHKSPPFRHLHKLYDLKLQAQQPYGMKIIPAKFFQGLAALRSLYLSENKLLSISPDAFDDLAQLQYLSLADSSNGMQDLPPGIFKNLSRLQKLNLENMGLHSLTLEVFGNLSNLTSLLLAKNQLQTVNASVANALGLLRYLDLRKCPLSCTCENLWFQNWLANRWVQVVYLYNYSCDSRQQLGYVYSFDTHVCFLDVGLYLFSVTTPALLLLMLLPLIYHRAYWRLKYHFYILRSWVNDRWRRQDGEHFQYDAFISYNSADEGWVLEQLVPSLESSQGSFRLCLHHRDFELGKSIVDNIVDSIYNSRKTVCVISRSYLQSEWCSLEIQLASYRLFEELKDVLVMVLLEAIPDRELSAYHRMRKVMLKKTYISWPLEPAAQRLFWTKLRKALKGSYMEEEEELYPFDEEDKPLLESTSQLG